MLSARERLVTRGGRVNNDQLALIVERDPAVEAAAAVVVASNALDAADAAELLGALGLSEPLSQDQLSPAYEALQGLRDKRAAAESGPGT